MSSFVISCFGECVTPMNDGPGVIAFENPNMGITTLLVRHRFAIPNPWTARTPGFEEFVGIPLAILGDPGRNVVGTLPEDQPH